MKFAQYLQDTQTPEWKKAYIDYRGLKKTISAIRAQQQQYESANSNSTPARDALRRATVDIDPPPSPTEPQSNSPPHVVIGRANTLNGSLSASRSNLVEEPNAASSAESGAAGGTRNLQQRRTAKSRPSLSIKVANPFNRTNDASGAPARTDSTPFAPVSPHGPFQFFRDSNYAPLPLRELIPMLPPLHAKFFERLDGELEKVEAFYVEREKEMAVRSRKLRDQLSDLKNHRKVFYEANANAVWSAKAHQNLTAALQALVPSASNTAGPSSNPTGKRVELDLSVKRESTNHSGLSGETAVPLNGNGNGNGKMKAIKAGSDSPKLAGHLSPKRTLEPQEYHNAKRKLKKAVAEHYRGLEILNNYRILNLTGFRKALKKYEKVTKVPAQAAYMKERVEPAAFASGVSVNYMLGEMEELFAARFERGDKKRAVNRLRAGSRNKSHHFSTFRSGVWMGLAVPALIMGLILCFQERTKAELPSWNVILFIYSVFLLFTLLPLLIGLNLLVWATERINYTFIFELDTRSRLDHREYFELPSFLCCTLAYAFFLSFARAGDPLIWPLVWLLVVLVVMFNPVMSLMWGRSRYWTIRNSAKLLGSGLWRVEFTDFWLGDQFTSLVYSLSDLFFIGCFYTRYYPTVPSSATLPRPTSPGPFPSFIVLPTPTSSGTGYASAPTMTAVAMVVTQHAQTLVRSAYDPNVQEAWTTCSTGHNWGYYYVLGVLPFLARFVQSLRRYYDSRLPTHLINAGKYGMGMVYYFFYYFWRHNNNQPSGYSFVLWVLFGTIYSLYACAWDFLMDWSLFQRNARYPLLRKEVMYTGHIPLYYVAFITNFLLRFSWLSYFPTGGINITVRTFIAAFLEILRRVQWNFYRLENEHLGNMDQYRATREVPLPYSDAAHAHDEDDEEDRDEDGHPQGSWLRRTLSIHSRRSQSHAVEEAT